MQVVDLALGGLDDDLGVDQAGGADDLLDHLGATPRARRAPGVADRNTHLADPLDELLEAQRPVVGRRRQAEAVLDERLLAAAVALVLAVELRAPLTWLSSSTTRKSSGKKSSRVFGRLARAPAVDRRRVVLDAVAEADLLHHLEVVLGAHAEALGLEQLALAPRTSASRSCSSASMRAMASRMRSSPVT